MSICVFVCMRSLSTWMINFSNLITSKKFNKLTGEVSYIDQIFLFRILLVEWQISSITTLSKGKPAQFYKFGKCLGKIAGPRFCSELTWQIHCLRTDEEKCFRSKSKGIVFISFFCPSGTMNSNQTKQNVVHSCLINANHVQLMWDYFIDWQESLDMQMQPMVPHHHRKVWSLYQKFLFLTMRTWQ